MAGGACGGCPGRLGGGPRRGGRLWEGRQIIDDTGGNRDGSIFATVDLDACDEAGELVLRTLDFSRLDG